jgi:hypothetical protein
VLFRHPRFSFFTPICFEDSFPGDIRRFVQEGAEAIVNISNDYWSLTEVEAKQHAVNSSLRAVENARPLLRATASGLTGYWDTDGTCLASAPYYQESHLVVDLAFRPEETTLYTRWGDWLPQPRRRRWLACAAVLFEGAPTAEPAALTRHAEPTVRWRSAGWWPLASRAGPGPTSAPSGATVPGLPKLEAAAGAAHQNTPGQRRGGARARRFAFARPGALFTAIRGAWRLIRPAATTTEGRKLRSAAFLAGLRARGCRPAAPARCRARAETADSILLYMARAGACRDAYTTASSSAWAAGQRAG